MLTNKKWILAAAASLALTLAPLGTLASAATASTEIVKVVHSVNFRIQPSTTGSHIRYLQEGETLELLDKPNNYWLHVKDSKGVSGYVSSSQQYTKIVEVSAPENYNGKVVHSVSFRTGPSTSDNRIRYLQAGEQILVLDKVNPYWYKITDEHNVTGYVSTSAQYIETSFVPPVQAPTPGSDSSSAGASQDDSQDLGDADYPWEPNATVLKSVSFRKGPSTGDARIRYLQTGEAIRIVDKVNNYWYEAEDKNGTLGYVSTGSSYIKTSYTEPYKTMTWSEAAQKVIAAGEKYLGTPYEYGSSRSDTSTFDCSDFVRQAFKDGIDQLLPGDSRSQAKFVREVGKTVTDWHNLQPGDLMFFMSYHGSQASDYNGYDKANQTVTHVGIYLGNGQILHTYSVASGGVKITDMAGTAWEYRFLFGGPTF